MAEEVPGTVTEDDKLWAALSYVFTPLVPVIMLLMEDKKTRPFIKKHTIQALVLGVVGVVLAATVVGACLTVILWGFQLYWAYQVYQGEEVEIPVVSDFVRNQGWV
ncbi:MAG: hypothetical protein GWN30_10410 [Gammaproteobacteria bacterium]|nr:hypothetical protein [Gammaproteobacteria bacterium]